MSKINSGWVRKQTAGLLSMTLALASVAAVPALATDVEGGSDATLEQPVEKEGEKDVEQAPAAKSSVPTANDDVTPQADAIATVNGTSCDSLGAVMAAAQVAAEAGQTVVIQLLGDVTGTASAGFEIPAGMTVELDFNGHKLIGTNAGSWIVNRGTLTINDSGNGSGCVYTTNTDAQGRHAVTNYGTLTINGGTFGDKDADRTNTNNVQRGNAVRNYGTAVINGGDFTACDNYTNGGYAYAIANGGDAQDSTAQLTINYATVYGNINGLVSSDGGTLTVKDGSYTLGDGEATNLWRMVYTSGRGVVNIEGGTFTKNAAGFDRGFFGGAVNVSGGTFADKVHESIYVDMGSVNISGGTFANGITAADSSELSVSGGTFAGVVDSKYCADGFQPADLGNGQYGVETLFSSGTGTAEDPFVISSVEQIKAFRDSVNNGQSYEGKVISLIQGTYDISESDVAWEPIGKGERVGAGYIESSFKGTFEGNGSTITGLSITGVNNNADRAQGFFGVLDGATVRDLALSNVNIKQASSECAGALAGLMTNGSTVDGVTVSGTVTAKSGVGGVVGRMTKTGTISNCVNNATVSGSGTNVGGIVGAAYYTSADGDMHITGCENAGAVTSGKSGANGMGTGGIVGLSAAFVEGCTNTAEIKADGYALGGIVGEQRNYGGITGCTNSGTVTNQSPAASEYGTGGIVGWVRYVQAGGADYPQADVISVTNNTNSGSVTGGNDAGGIAGTVYNAAVVTGNTSTAASLTSENFVAGIVGNLQFTETPGGNIPSAAVTVSNNVSTTALDSMTGTLKGQYVYDNTSGTNPDVVTDDNATEWAARVDGTNYVSLSAAIDAAGEGQTVALLGNVTESVTIPEGKNLTLDLAGNTLTNTDGQHTVTVEKGATLTVTDSSEGKTGVIDNVSHARGALVNEGTVTVESGTLTRSKEAGKSPSDNGGNSWYVIDNQGTMTFDGGAVTSTGKYSSLIRNLNGTLTINDGEFKNGFIALKNDDGGVLEITGGTITSDEQAIQNWSKAEISGGTLNGSVIAWDYGEGDNSTTTISGNAVINGDVKAVNYLNAKQGPTVNITGGTINGEVSKGTHDGTSGIQAANPSSDTSQIVVSGGTFEKAPADEFIVLGSGLTKNPDGTFGIHGHVGTAVAAKEPTCTEAGTKAHWVCSECGELFADEEMTQPTTLEAVTIGATGHQSVSHVAAKDATETEAGNREYWHCADCGRYFLDAALTKETTLAAVTIPAKGQEPVETHTVTLVLGTGEPNRTIEVADGEALPQIAVPTSPGYTFLAWYADADLTVKYDLAAPVTGDLTLYAGWTKDGEKDDSTTIPEKEAEKEEKGDGLAETGDATLAAPVVASAAAGVFALAAARRLRGRDEK